MKNQSSEMMVVPSWSLFAPRQDAVSLLAGFHHALLIPQKRLRFSDPNDQLVRIERCQTQGRIV